MIRRPHAAADQNRFRATTQARRYFPGRADFGRFVVASCSTPAGNLVRPGRPVAFKVLQAAAGLLGEGVGRSSSPRNGGRKADPSGKG